MKFRHVFIIFGVIIVLVFGAVAAQNVFTQFRLSHTLPQYERDFETGAYIIDGTEYYIVSESNFMPVEVDERPFGVYAIDDFGFASHFLHWVDTSGGAWIYMDVRLTLTAHSMHVLRRADMEVPSPADVMVNEVCLSSERYPQPIPARQPHITPLLEDAEDVQAFVDALLESDVFVFTFSLEQEQFRPEGLQWIDASLQLRCEEYPGMAFVYQLHVNPEDQIVLQSGDSYITLDNNYITLTLIKEALSQ